jgi:beta-galactosidase
MRFGVCYHPEQWAEDRWKVDARIMVEAGIEMVRIGEFSWSTIQPSPDRHSWASLDRVIATLAEAGLKVVLATPIAAPPVWITAGRPEILAMGPDGLRRPQTTCPTSAAFRADTAKIVMTLVKRYGKNKNIVAWQIGNEPGGQGTHSCWCDECQSAFGYWLKDRYKTIDNLNRAWGTAFRSETYPDFETVKLPMPTTTNLSPAHRLAHRRFANRQVITGLTEQYRLIKRGSPGRDILTNISSTEIDLDAGDVARLGGIHAIDSYPHVMAGPLDPALSFDRRPAGPLTRVWVMEQQVGPINRTPLNPPVPRGQAWAWIAQAAEHGVETMFFSRWRASRFGQDQYHSGLLSHDGTPTRVFEEIRGAIAEFADAQPAKAREVALLWSSEDAWLMDINPLRQDLTHRLMLLEVYAACRRLGLSVAVVNPVDDLSSYSIVLAPALLITDPERQDSIWKAVDAGNLVILGPRSLVMDPEGAVTDQPKPSGFSIDLEATVTESISQIFDVRVSPYGAKAGPWTDVVSTQGASTIATYSGGTYLDGQPAAVRKGNLVYAGFSDREAWTALLSDLTGIPPRPEKLVN